MARATGYQPPGNDGYDNGEGDESGMNMNPYVMSQRAVDGDNGEAGAAYPPPSPPGGGPGDVENNQYTNGQPSRRSGMLGGGAGNGLP
jgi:hypothetical protein